MPVKIEVFRDVLSQKDWDLTVQKTIKASGWSFSGYSLSEDDGKFWYLDLTNDDWVAQTFFGLASSAAKVPVELERVYANGQTHGLSGRMHQDNPDGNGLTFLYYVNPVWKPEWGGTTVFENGTDVYHHYPAPNTAVLFPGEVKHAGMEPTRHCKDLRVTLAVKMIRR